MRHIVIFGLLLFSIVRLPAQPIGQPSNDPIAAEDPAFNGAFAHRQVPVVQGRILHLTVAECRQLPITYSLVTPFASFQSKQTAALADDGTFTLKLNYALPYQQIWLQVGDLFYGGLYVDEDLRVELDAQKLKAVNGVTFFGDGVNFAGTDGPLNVYLSQKLARRSPDQQRLSMQRQMLATRAENNTDSVLAMFRRLTDSLDTIEAADIAAHPSPYSKFILNEDRSESYSLLCLFYRLKKMPDSLWTLVNLHKPWCVSNSGMLFYNYLAMYIQASQGPHRGSLPLTLQRIDSLFPAAKSDFFKMRLGSSMEIESQQASLHLIVASLHTPWCADVMSAESRRTDKKVEEINKALAAARVPEDSTALGRPLLTADFGATLYKMNLHSASDLLTRLIRAFPGKAIIVDRWATWCVPCIGEMPHSKQLQQDAAGLPVVFVYLCTKNNSSEEKWKTSVFNLHQPGVHIFIDEKLDAELSNYFSFHGYPGYAYIGRDGKYKPGVFQRISEIADRKALEALIGR